MRSYLLVFMFVFGTNQAHSATSSLSTDIEKVLARKLLLATSEVEVSQLSERVSKIRELVWLCQKEWDEQDLPLACYRLIDAIESSEHFRSVSLEGFLEKLELQCGVALHHLSSPSLVHFKRYKEVRWPNLSACHRDIQKRIERLQYIEATRY